LIAGSYVDPGFWWLVVGGSAVSAVSFGVFASALTWLAWREPAWARSWRVQERRADVRRRLGAAVRAWGINQVVLLSLLVVTWPVWGRHSPIRVEAWPTLGEVAVQVLGFIYLDDLLFYGMHRALHWGWLYERVHRWHHRVRTPFAFTGHDMHPVEYVAIAVLMLVGPWLAGAHVVTVYAWVVVRQWEAAEGHCGYHLPFSPLRLLPGHHGADFHDFHHSRLVGNYAGFLAWVDRVAGTWAKGYAEHVAARKLRWWGA